MKAKPGLPCIHLASLHLALNPPHRCALSDAPDQVCLCRVQCTVCPLVFASHRFGAAWSQAPAIANGRLRTFACFMTPPPLGARLPMPSHDTPRLCIVPSGISASSHQARPRIQQGYRGNNSMSRANTHTSVGPWRRTSNQACWAHDESLLRRFQDNRHLRAGRGRTSESDSDELCGPPSSPAPCPMLTASALARADGGANKEPPAGPMGSDACAIQTKVSRSVAMQQLASKALPARQQRARS